MGLFYVSFTNKKPHLDNFVGSLHEYVQRTPQSELLMYHHEQPALHQYRKGSFHGLVKDESEERLRTFNQVFNIEECSSMQLQFEYVVKSQYQISDQEQLQAFIRENLTNELELDKLYFGLTTSSTGVRRRLFPSDSFITNINTLSDPEQISVLHSRVKNTKRAKVTGLKFNDTWLFANNPLYLK